VLRGLFVYLYFLVFAFMTNVPVHKKHQTFVWKNLADQAVRKLIPYSESLHRDPIVNTNVFLTAGSDRN